MSDSQVPMEEIFTEQDLQNEPMEEIPAEQDLQAEPD